MSRNLLPELGPLAPLLGTWEGEKGHDTAPSDDRATEINLFRERITFEFIGCVNNHEQTLYGLKYAKKAWRIGEADGFHEEVGYWLWDAQAKQAMRSFIVPRGIAVIAGGTVEPQSKVIDLTATVGSDTYGICSNKFLDVEFKTMRFTSKVTIHDLNSFTYEEVSELKIKGQTAHFLHKDRNTLRRVE